MWAKCSAYMSGTLTIPSVLGLLFLIDFLKEEAETWDIPGALIFTGIWIVSGLIFCVTLPKVYEIYEEAKMPRVFWIGLGASCPALLALVNVSVLLWTIIEKIPPLAKSLRKAGSYLMEELNT